MITLGSPFRPSALDARMLRAAELAYIHSSSLLERGLAEIGLELLERFGAGSRNFIARDRDAAYLLYRGTEADWRDIREDLDACFFRPSLPGWALQRVHEGFWICSYSGWDHARGVLSKLSLPINVGGHSLGAAAATLAAARLKIAKLPIAALVTAGSPRAAGDGLTALLEGVPHRRYVHCCDVVPKLPGALFGWRHVPELIYIDRFARFWRGPSLAGCLLDQAQAWRSAALELAGAPFDIGRWEALGLAHHRIARYRAAAAASAMPA